MMPVFPVPVGASTTGGSPSRASLDWYPYGGAPVAPRKNSSNDSIGNPFGVRGQRGDTFVHGARTFHCWRRAIKAWLAAQPSGNFTGTFRWTGSVEGWAS